jgi:hypothetical protein
MKKQKTKKNAKSTIKGMYLLDDHDLFDIMRNKELFASFNLRERDEKILKLRVLKGLTFEIIAGIEIVSVSAAHKLYTDAKKRLRKQLLRVLKENLTAKTKKKKPVAMHIGYIGGNGEACDYIPLDSSGKPSVLAVGW